ncbi:glycosyltransferase family 2 protein [Methanobacterium alkalithermotolerans]|uniref:Glycosyltransferase family 2 protein n=1 Tax=Methanobacterium alkalithermotolerans TaxID=2731220 RepID=A0A8T8KB82_9EURY|nr:glycosyltransferase family 2 protein [Methanobacterium alkalithermotolerans]QUH22661.1 glycosyltransferase family 2 protein [Methanobacterium alkalithermotolerans]
MNDPRVSIVMVNWNGWRDTLECLDSIWEIDYPNYDIVIVDNDSSDDSVVKIREYLNLISDGEGFSDAGDDFQVHEVAQINILMDTPVENPPKHQITLIRARKNWGFAGGNNLGIKYALKFLKPDYLLLLNNDTVVEADFLTPLVETVSGDVGVVGPKTCYFPEKEYINSAGVKMIWPWVIAQNQGIGELDQGQFDEVQEVDALLGACLLIKAEVFQEIGLLDSNFFLILEETDFCLRAHQQGYQIIYQPLSKIYHKEGFSGRLSQLSLYYFYRNRFLIMKKHLNPSKIVLFSNLVFFRLLKDVLTFFLRGEWGFSWAAIRGYYAGLKF